MSMQISNAAAKNVNWESILSSLGSVEKADKVDSQQNFTITTTVDGQTRTMTVSVPDDLEIPETVDQGTLEGLIDKLKGTGLGFTDEQITQMKDSIAKLFEASTAAAGTVRGKSTGQVLYDIYAILALMIDVAQSQRDAAREMRTAENLAVQKAIQNQADDQRSAAMVGMIVGITCGLASAAVSVGMMVGQGISAKTQSKIMEQSGADAAKMHTDMFRNSDTVDHAQSQLQTTMNNVGDRVATDVLHKFEQSMNDPQLGNLRNVLNEAVQTNETAQNTLVTKKSELQAAQETLDQKAAALEQAQTAYDNHPGKAALEASRARQQHIRDAINAGKQPDQQKLAEYDAIIGKADIQSAQEAFLSLNTAKEEHAVAQQVVRTKQGDVQIAQQEANTTATALDKARNDYLSTVRGVADEYQAKYQEAVNRQANPPEGMTQQELADGVAKAKSEMQMAFAVEADLLAHDNVMTPTARTSMAKELNARVDVTTQATYQRADFKAAERRMSVLQGINNINLAIGQITQSTASNLAALRSAEATRQGADSKKEEEMLDQTKDLFAQEQKLIDQAIQLSLSVIQAENQSMRDAIQA